MNPKEYAALKLHEALATAREAAEYLYACGYFTEAAMVERSLEALLKISSRLQPDRPTRDLDPVKMTALALMVST